MSLELYDKSLLEKLESLFSNVIMAPTDDAFKRSNEDGKVLLPLISAYRLSNPINMEDYNRYEVFSGRLVNIEENSKLIKQQGLPITITYQIDIWAAKRIHADGLFRELVYHLLTNPNLSIQLS